MRVAKKNMQVLASSTQMQYIVHEKITTFNPQQKHYYMGFEAFCLCYIKEEFLIITDLDLFS